jgi:hypothetical protein
MSILSPAGFRGAVLAGVLVLAPPSIAWAAAQAPGVPTTAEYELKAAFLFNFTRFVEWPAEAFASASAPITIGILGDDPFGSSLDDMIANELVHGRKLTVRRYASVEELEPCQILFVCPGELEHWEAIASKLGKRAILTVGDGSGFTARSGMIGFEMVNHHLRLRVNLAATRAAKLVISSQLLRQAKIVGPEANP